MLKKILAAMQWACQKRTSNSWWCAKNVWRQLAWIHCCWTQRACTLGEQWDIWLGSWCWRQKSVCLPTLCIWRLISRLFCVIKHMTECTSVVWGKITAHQGAFSKTVVETSFQSKNELSKSLICQTGTFPKLFPGCAQQKSNATMKKKVKKNEKRNSKNHTINQSNVFFLFSKRKKKERDSWKNRFKNVRSFPMRNCAPKICS